MTDRKLTLLILAGAALLAVVASAAIAVARPFGGTAGDDVLAGTNGRDRIKALAGNDKVYAKRGRDRVFAGEGNDTVYAGRGLDKVFGNAGDDILYGGPGPDRLKANVGVDTLYGGLGNDDLWALAHDDVTGAADEPADTLRGGPGRDRFHVRDGEADHVDCGDGFDVVLADFKDDIANNCERVRRHAPVPRDD